MRSESEIMKLITEKAEKDENIRAAYMTGSRVDPGAVHDKYCDFDIVYIVRGIQTFTKNPSWIEYFGELLIVQQPADWYSHPYDYSGNENFSYLMQFKDGNRIDLTLVDVKNIESAINNAEPRKILLNKDAVEKLSDIPVEAFYNTKKPGRKEFSDCCNEFFWVSLYVAKGLCRDELMYSRVFMEQTVMAMLLKMLDWSLGIDNGFTVCTGKNHRYLKRYLGNTEMEALRGLLSSGDTADMWDKLVKMVDCFNRLSVKAANALNYEYNAEQAVNVRDYLLAMKAGSPIGRFV